MAVVAIAQIVSGLLSLITGKPATIDYSIKDAITEVEKIVGQSLPEAWEYWNTYEGETKWGNEMFFIWNKREHWAIAQKAVEDLQGYLKKVIADFEAEQKRKAAEQAAPGVTAEAPTWGKYLPILAILGILALSYKK